MTAAPLETPTYLPVLADHIPDALHRPQWLGWRASWRAGKWTKLPIDPETGQVIDATDPARWSTPHRTLEGYRARRLDGVGFGLHASDPFAAVDLDGCRDPESGVVARWALAIVAELHSYTEVSPSGTGLRIFVKGSLPVDGRRKGPIEVYQARRFVTVTGHHLAGTPRDVEDRGEELAAFYAETFGQVEILPAPRATPASVCRLDDATLIERATAANGSAACSPKPTPSSRRVR